MEEVRRLITVELFTDTFRYVGDIVIIGLGHNKRLTDYLNSSQPFIPILNPKLYTITGDLVREEEIVIINKNAIKFVFPLEETQEKAQEKAKKYIDSQKYFKDFGDPLAPQQPPGTRKIRTSPSQLSSSTSPQLSSSVSPPAPPRPQKLQGPPPNLSETNPFMKKPEEEKS
ncbi:MAG: hypothetical protein AABZ60_15040 [Planctomycetota bacterium]